MATLDADDLADAHPYLAKAWPQWSRSMASIKLDGGPWPCDTCPGPSYLTYRCSKCGADLTTAKATSGRQS